MSHRSAAGRAGLAMPTAIRKEGHPKDSETDGRDMQKRLDEAKNGRTVREEVCQGREKNGDDDGEELEEEEKEGSLQGQKGFRYTKEETGCWNFLQEMIENYPGKERRETRKICPSL